MNICILIIYLTVLVFWYMRLVSYHFERIILVLYHFSVWF